MCIDHLIPEHLADKPEELAEMDLRAEATGKRWIDAYCRYQDALQALT